MIDEELHLRDFIDGYIYCLLWSTNDESTESGGVPLDQNYTADDFSPLARERIKRDCEKFFEEQHDLIDEVRRSGTHRCSTRLDLIGPCSIWSEAGHDFWFTRNDHGCGFWDGDWPEAVGEKLSEAAKKFGNEWPYVGDDGLIHLSME